MGVLVTARQIADFYRELWVECYSTPPPDYLRHDTAFPPFLCRSLAYGDPELPRDCPRLTALTGRPDGESLRVEAGPLCLEWGTVVADSFLRDRLNLVGHRMAAHSPPRETWLRSAAELLSALSSPAAECVNSFIGLIVWLDVDANAPEPITSSSFPAVPHLTAMTDKSSRELLPDSYLPEASAWVLAEDLYHESLHQWLSATMMIHDIFVENYIAAEGPLIEIPWRNSRWPVDRSLHSLFVYSHLVQLRICHLHEADVSFAEREAVVSALPAAIDAIRQLIPQLESERSCYTPLGQQLLDEIVAKARAVVSASKSGSPL